MIIRLCVGDTGFNSHCITKTFLIEVDVSASELEKAFKDGADKIGVNLTDHCKDYEDSKLEEAAVLRFEAAGFKFDDYPYCKDWEQVRVTPEMYFALYMFTVFHGNRLISWTEIKPSNSNVMNIGGYGILSN